MKPHLPIFLAATISLTITLDVQSQLTVDSTASVDDLVLGIFQGTGVTISGATINSGVPLIGATGHYVYSGSSPIPEEGIILSTGQVMHASLPATDFAAWYNGNYQDQDMNDLAQQTIYEATVLEFDFIPNEDQMMFEYVFASEEYPEHACSQYNDVFGFFLSGPNISGPFSNNAVNVAVLPNSNIPVAINTVNSGIPMSPLYGYDPAICEMMDPNWQSNSQYYVDNENGLDIVYDGFTVILQVSALVTPGDQHHLKIAVADAGDDYYDSAIFLQAASFRSVPSLATQLAREREAGHVNAWFNEEGALTIEAGEDMIGEIRLLDMNGRLVAQKRIDSNGRIMITDLALPTGVYILEAGSDGQLLRAKLAKH